MRSSLKIGQSIVLRRIFPCVLAIYLMSAAGAAAQSADLGGLVRDSSGGVIPNATVVVGSTGTSVQRVVESGRDGRFVLPALPAGEYQLTIVAPGFEAVSMTARVPGVDLLDVVLAPAAVA